MAPLFVSAGNSGDCWDGSCRSPSDEGLPSGGSIGYNVFSVGGLDDHDTGNTADDTIAGFSSHKDPISHHNDRIKPELVAPAVAIGSLNNSWRLFRGWHVWQWGTSFASPIASGAAALLMAREGKLSFQPEAIKALLLTASVQNIHGGAPLSTRDGGRRLQQRARRPHRARDRRWLSHQTSPTGSASPTVLATETIRVTQQQVDARPPRARCACLAGITPCLWRQRRPAELPNEDSGRPRPLSLAPWLDAPRRSRRAPRTGSTALSRSSSTHRPSRGDYTLMVRHHGFCLNPGLWGVPVAWAWSTSL